RYHKLLSDEVLWLPGADHAGFETQFVFEKELKKQGKSRFDYDQETLFKMIWEFVMKNRDNMENQLRRLGFALDWSKKKFTMDKEIVEIVYQTFENLYKKGLVYRDTKIINYCTFCGTSFSDLEVVDKEKTSALYYIRYPLVESNDYLVVATTRPETLLGDTAVAVNPKDKRYKKLIGKQVVIPFVERKVSIIADDFVDPKFGTGAVKVTPAHDFNDFEVGKRHHLDLVQVIDFDGKINQNGGEFVGLYVGEARKKIVEKLKEKNLLEKIDENYKNRVGTCYKCTRPLEPLPKEQWFVKIKPLAQKAKKYVSEEKIKIYPKRFKKILLWWLDNFRDWNISRQIVWGIRIPAYKCKSKIRNQWFVSVEKPKKCLICGSCDFEQDTDTFDTWFSSGQWPYATLKSFNVKSQKLKDSNFFDYFYPTSVMETGYDILPWWVARMIMLGLFTTGKVPFKNVFLHGLIRDKHGQKMSKSKGNVINPMEMIEKYGADALRLALIFGTKEGSDILFSEEKVIGMRNFVNKIWNIGRFIYLNKNQKSKIKNQKLNEKSKMIKNLNKEVDQLEKKYFKMMDSYRFSKALGLLYDFIWHRIADFYLEQLKDEVINGNIKALNGLEEAYLESLKMIHPFAPFVSEAIYQIFKGQDKSILSLKLKI
ncbi:MAG: valine--tRNA ligase, partial [Microgenomates group bacterium]